MADVIDIATAKKKAPKRERQTTGDWQDQLSYSKQGDLKPTFGNVVDILRHDDTYSGTMAFNSMSAMPELAGRPMTDADFGGIRVDLERRYLIATTEDTVVKAIGLVAGNRSYHPVADYLESLTWDGTPRIGDVATRLLGAPDEPLFHAMVRRFFVASVARPLCPGTKVDNMLVLTGEQGGGKTTFFRDLAGEWFTDTTMNLDSKDAYQVLGVSWLVEWGELDTLSKTSAERVKAFLSSPEDAFRVPYARMPIRVKRTAVVVGTTNSDSFLKDPTGSRRFWIVPVGKVDTELTKQWRDQLWAEAVTLYRANEAWWLTPEEDADRAAEATNYEETDPWESSIGLWIDRQMPGDKFTTATLLKSAVGFDDDDKLTRQHEMRATAILKRIGCVREKNPVTADGKRVRHWMKPETKAATE